LRTKTEPTESFRQALILSGESAIGQLVAHN
jgi:hypothetical protein